MLTTQNTISMNFGSAASALQYVNARTYRRYLIDTQNIEIDKEGKLSYVGMSPRLFAEIPITDVCLQHINSLVGITPPYSNKIDPSLHAYSINKQLKKLEAMVTVVIESSQKNPDHQKVVAFLPGACSGIDDLVILQRLEYWNLTANIEIRSGQMDVFFGNPDLIEVLPYDQVNLQGALRNIRWGQTRSKTNPSLDVSVFWKRLICSNGAYIKRDLAAGKLMNLASKQEVIQFLDRQFERINNFPQITLKNAVAIMTKNIPEESEHDEIKQSITRSAGDKIADELMITAVSWWDHFNAITAAANKVENLEKQRKLQIAGGAILERFITM